MGILVNGLFQQAEKPILPRTRTGRKLIVSFIDIQYTEHYLIKLLNCVGRHRGLHLYFSIFWRE
jgi:hypothetical protein